MDTDYQDINYVASVHPEMAYCHSEPFDRLREESPANQGNKRFFVVFAPQNDTGELGFRMETS
jgi:hypothetical protein